MEIETPDVLEDEEESAVNVNDEIVIPDTHQGTVDNPFLYNASSMQLEQFLLTNVFVAGKNASIQQQKLNQFIACVKRDIGAYAVETIGVLSAINAAIPTDSLKDKVTEWLKEIKAGQYSRISQCVYQICTKIKQGKLNLQTCSRSTLVSIKGIGLKTASMFLMYTRSGWPGACLDTHILKYLKEKGVDNVPTQTPTIDSEYFRLERIFIDMASKELKTVANFDYEIWSSYRQKVATV